MARLYTRISDRYIRLKRKRKESISKRALCLLYSRPGQYVRRVRIYTTTQEKVSMHHLAINKAHALLHHRLVLSSNSRASQSHHDRYWSFALSGTEHDVVARALNTTTAACLILAISPRQAGRASASSWRGDQPRLQRRRSSAHSRP